MNWQQAFVIMILGHLIADYTLQGWLADGKQLSWWQKVVPGLGGTRYEKDYIAALVCHAIYWSIFVCAPLWGSSALLPAIAVNAAVHAWVDHLKANQHAINLIQDQLAHAVQILATFAVWVFVV